MSNAILSHSLLLLVFEMFGCLKFDNLVCHLCVSHRNGKHFALPC